MTGDSENEFDNVGETPTPAPPPPESTAEEGEIDRAPRKRFRAWSSAQQEEAKPGVLGQLGKRISGIFKKAPAEPEPEAQPQSSDLELIMPEPIEASIEPAVQPAFETPVEAAFETPIEAASALPEADMGFDVVPESEPIETADIVPDVTEKPRRPSLLARLFGRRKEEPIAEPLRASDEPALEALHLEKDDFSELQPSAPEDEPLISAAADPQLQETLEPTFIEPARVEEPVADVGRYAALEAEPVAHIEPPYEEHSTAPMDELPPPIEEPPTEPMPERRGLFGRLFSRKPKVSRPVPIERPVEQIEAPVEEPVAEQIAQVDEPVEIEATVDEMPALQAFEAPVVEEELVRTDEHETPAPEELGVGSWESGVASGELEAQGIPPEDSPLGPQNSDLKTFSSVEDALPAEPEPSTVDLIEAALSEPIPEEEKKPGLFARLFGRKSKPEPRPSLEIEFHEDRIEAAAHALDEVSGEHFSGSPAAQVDPYASVEDALPSELRDASDDEVRDTSDEVRVTPMDEEVPTRNSELATVDDSDLATRNSDLAIQPFDPFAETLDPSRDTIETTPDPRSTLEIEQREPRSTEELELEAELGLNRDPGDTLEIAERKTDEFEIPSVDPEATTGEIVETETTQAAKLTWWMRLLGRKPTTEAEAGVPAGTVVEGNPNFLFTKFKAFYNEIIRFKHQKTEFAAGFSTAILTDFHADVSPEGAAAAQSEQLKTMLDLQAAEAQWMGGEAKERYPEAQYAMACMADELFMHMEWDGQAAWKNHLLEVKLFRSHAADVELFKRIDKLLKEQPNSHVARDLARVYLLVLAAGFQGKYRPFDLPRALAEYRQRLYEYIHQDDSLMLYAPDRKIFPDAAARTLEGHAVGRFSSLQRWAAILVFLVLGYTAVAHYAWNKVSADLKDVTERIRAASSNTGAATSPTSANANAASGGGR